MRLAALLTDARDTLDAFLRPVMADERAAAAAVWARLPPDLRGPDQVLGRHSAGCAGTYGVYERCDFACTACYLAHEANHTPPLPFEEVRAQLDVIRAHLGRFGNTQITAGEVTLLPVGDLVRILRYCREIELTPMLMTNGQTLLRDPRYLERLVEDGGLDRIAVHIDTTQRGRDGMAPGAREPDIHAIRHAFAELIRETRRRTDRPLAAAHTFTITEENFDDVPGVTRWVVENADAFRMISFQPAAEVGRTRATEQVGRKQAIWGQICRGLGVSANHRAFIFGHPECNTVALLFVVDIDGQREVVEMTRDQPVDWWFWRRLLHGGFAGYSPDGEPGRVALARLLGRMARRPRLFADVPAFCAARAWSERAWLPRLLATIARGGRWSIKPLVIVVHHFMSTRELDTPQGRDRLESCCFRVPVDGRMMSMCELNGTPLRAELNRADRARLRPPRPLSGDVDEVSK